MLQMYDLCVPPLCTPCDCLFTPRVHTPQVDNHCSKQLFFFIFLKKRLSLLAIPNHTIIEGLKVPPSVIISSKATHPHTPFPHICVLTSYPLPTPPPPTFRPDLCKSSTATTPKSVIRTLQR